MDRGLIKPILWTIISVIAIILVFLADNNDTVWAIVFVIVAIACAVLQWFVYRKNREAGSAPKIEKGKSRK